MERRFVVEAKSFSLSATKGKSEICLEERRKRFSGSISLGIRCSDWLANMVEEAIMSPGKEEFVKSFRVEVEVLMVCKGSNKAGCFLQATVFAKGGWKGVIWLTKG